MVDHAGVVTGLRRAAACGLGAALASLLLSCSAGPADGTPGSTSPVAGDPRAPARAFEARIERVVDGDTVVARLRGARPRVRLIGIDAPESVTPGAPVECWGPEAAAMLRALLPPGITVRAAYQPGGRRDRYDRELWDVWLPDGRFLQAVMVRRGAAAAVAYPPQLAHSDLLERVESGAIEHRRGLWGSCGGRT